MDDELERELQQMMRQLLAAGGQGAEMVARSRQRRIQHKIEAERRKIAQLEQAHKQADRAARANAEAQREAARERRDTLRAGWEPSTWGDWRDEATLSDWATAYTYARTARDEGDPQAARAADFIRDEVARRYNVDLAREYNRMNTASADEGVAARIETSEREHADADRADIPEPEVLTDAEYQRRHRNTYVGVGGDWIDRATPEEFVEVYQTAREMEAHDPVARVAARNLEQKMAERNPERYPGGAADFRAHWDQVMETMDKGARTSTRAPGDRLGADRALDHEERRDTARDQKKGADAREQHHRREVDRLSETTARTNTSTDIEVARGVRTVELAAPAHGQLEKKAPTRRSSKPKSRDTREQTKTRKRGK